MTIVSLIAGLALILAGANYMTDGASDLAHRFRISEFVIGVTVIGIGTSTPELVISVLSALNGQDDLAVGNIVGSNLFNTLMILGITAVIFPVTFTKDNVRKDILFGLLASCVLFVAASDTLFDARPVNTISRSEGIVMLLFYLLFLFYTLFSAQDKTVTAEESHSRKPRKLWLTVLMVIGGLAALIYGGELFLNGAVGLARQWGMSESVIAVTVVAAGTSLPELVACLVAAVKKKPGFALGNIIGSNITNIFLVLGLSAVISPLTTGNIIPEDLFMLVASSLLLFITAFTFRRRTLDRSEGIFFIISYICYIVWILNR